MPSRTTQADKTTHCIRPMHLRVSSDAAAASAPSTEAEACQWAVRAIWRSLDEHCLVDEQVRSDLALVLEPVTRFVSGDRLQRLLLTLRLPDPIDASRLYWLTRRLLTIVPELQAAETRLSGADPDPAEPDD